ncbi:hypothetical protein D3Z50_20495 [Clostridiaceae bacterium]|nr:hypothetical protein [Clostridiaceae bacterium]
MADAAAWLKTKVYTTNKKELQKNNLFVDMASEDSLKEFVSKYGIFLQVDINRYKKELMEALAKAYPNPDKDGNEEHWQFILLV